MPTDRGCMTTMDRLSRSIARRIPYRRCENELIASATRTAVLKSGFLRSRTTSRDSGRSLGVSLSIKAPLAMRPEVGTPCSAISARPASANPDNGNGPLSRGVKDAVRSSQGRHDQCTAHQRARIAKRRHATSMRVPTAQYGGTSAGTMTAATLRVRIRPLRTDIPRRSSIDCNACSVNTELRSVSPDPSRPTTRP